LTLKSDNMRQHQSETFVKPMRQAEWRALQYRNAVIEDKIAVRNLQVTVNAGQDAWGREKTQPALLTVTLSLTKSFNSAAAADALDGSTIHYGQLSKVIEAGVENSTQHYTSSQLASRVGSCIFEAAGETDLHAYEIEIFYPKGSLLGDGAGWSYSELEVPRHGRFSSEALHLRNLRIPCIIGINANEREHAQPVVVNLWLENMPTHLSDGYPRIEAAVVNVS
jgi:dihydroneopterin aldolase